MLFGSPKKVAFFCAHTDDEMVCAGTLARLVREGSRVMIACMSVAATRKDRRGADVYESNEVIEEWKKATDLIGVKPGDRWLTKLRPSADFYPHRQAIADVLFEFVETHQPDVVFTLSPDDENPAHRIVGEESERVLRGRCDTVVRCQFPWNYSTGRKNLFVQLDKTDWGKKLAVCDCYSSQAFRYEYRRMFESYSVGDGLSVKCGPCETFELLRGIV